MTPQQRQAMELAIELLEGLDRSGHLAEWRPPFQSGYWRALGALQVALIEDRAAEQPQRPAAGSLERDRGSL